MPFAHARGAFPYLRLRGELCRFRVSHPCSWAAGGRSFPIPLPPGDCERDDRFAGQVAALRKDIDDVRRDVPPDREGNEHSGYTRPDLSAHLRFPVVPMDRAFPKWSARMLVNTVQIRPYVWRFRLNFHQIGAGCVRQRACQIRGRSRCGKIGCRAVLSLL